MGFVHFLANINAEVIVELLPEVARDDLLKLVCFVLEFDPSAVPAAKIVSHVFDIEAHESMAFELLDMFDLMRQEG